MRNCARCGKSFEPPPMGARARFCGAACRQAAHRARRMGIPEATLAAVSVLTSPEPDDEPVGLLMGLEDVARELQRVLRSEYTPPTAKASLAKEYRVTLAEIAKATPAKPDALDELLARRVRNGAPVTPRRSPK